MKFLGGINNGDEGNSEEEDEDFILGGDVDDELQDSDADDEHDESFTATSQDQLGVSPSGRKRKRSVSFNKIVDVDKDSHSILTGSSSSEEEDDDDSSEDEDEDEDDSQSDTSSSDEDNSEEEDEGAQRNAKRIKLVNGASNSDASSEASSEDDSSDSSAEKQLKTESQTTTRIPTDPNQNMGELNHKPLVPPGQGKRETHKRNQRRRQKNQLNKLIQIGVLPAGANVTDLQVYLEKAGSSSSLRSDAIEDEETQLNELEAQRQRLLKQLQNGGVDVEVDVSDQPNKSSAGNHHSQTTYTVQRSDDANSSSSIAKSSRDTNKPSASNGEVTQKLGVAEEEHKRPRLNLASSNRLIFGSLGVRTPRSKDDGDKVRQKLAARGDPQHVATSSLDNSGRAVPSTVESGQEVPANDLSDMWKSKISLKAVECFDDGVDLSEPPFPFVQCWDEQYVWNRPQERSRKKRTRKKRSHQQQEVQDADEEERALEFNEDMYDEEESLAKPEPKTHIRYNDEGGEEMLVENAGFPPLPVDVEALPTLGAEYCNVGVHIAFKALHVDASTKWQPEISNWQVARVDDNIGSNGLTVKLAPQYRSTVEARYDEDGRRIRDGFEMPSSDDDEGDEVDMEQVDDGVRTIALEAFMDVRLLSSGSEFNGRDSQGTNGEPAMLASTQPVDKPVTPTKNGDPENESDIEWDGIGDEAEDYSAEVNLQEKSNRHTPQVTKSMLNTSPEIVTEATPGGPSGANIGMDPLSNVTFEVHADGSTLIGAAGA